MQKRITEVFGLVDCHTHCGGIDINNFYQNRYPCTQDATVLHKTMQDSDIAFAITFPMPSTMYFNTRKYWEERVFVSSGFEDIPFQRENAYLLSELKSFGYSSILPFMAVSLRDKVQEQHDYLRALMESFGFYGLKFHSKTDQKPISAIETEGAAFIELAEEYNLPFMLHAEKNGIASPMSIFSIASRHPNIRFCIAHFAGFSKDFFCEFDEYRKTYSNIFLDTAPSIFLISHTLPGQDVLDLNYENPFQVLQFFLSNYRNHLLWGTDCPWLFAAPFSEGKIFPVVYRDEVNLRKNVEHEFTTFSTATTNTFLFGNKEMNINGTVS